MNYKKTKLELNKLGYTSVNQLYSEDEINKMNHCIETSKIDGNTLTNSSDLFANYYMSYLN